MIHLINALRKLPLSACRRHGERATRSARGVRCHALTVLTSVLILLATRADAQSTNQQITVNWSFTPGNYARLEIKSMPPYPPVVNGAYYTPQDLVFTPGNYLSITTGVVTVTNIYCGIIYKSTLSGPFGSQVSTNFFPLALTNQIGPFAANTYDIAGFNIWDNLGIGIYYSGTNFVQASASAVTNADATVAVTKSGITNLISAAPLGATVSNLIAGFSSGLNLTNGSGRVSRIGPYTGPTESAISLYASNADGPLVDLADFIASSGSVPAQGMTLNYGTVTAPAGNFTGNLNAGGNATFGNLQVSTNIQLTGGGSVSGASVISSTNFTGGGFAGNGSGLTNVNLQPRAWYVQMGGSDANSGNNWGANNAFLTLTNALFVSSNAGGSNIINLGIGTFNLPATTNGTWITTNQVINGSGYNTLISFPSSGVGALNGNVGFRLAGDNIALQNFSLGTNSGLVTYDYPVVGPGGKNILIQNVSFNSASDGIVPRIPYQLTNFSSITLINDYFTNEFDGGNWDSSGAAIGSTVYYNGCHFHSTFNSAYGNEAWHGIRNDGNNGVNLTVVNCDFWGTNGVIGDGTAAAIYANAGTTYLAGNIYNVDSHSTGVLVNSPTYFLTPVSLAQFVNNTPFSSAVFLPSGVFSDLDTYDNLDGSGNTDFTVDYQGNIRFSAADGGGKIIWTNSVGTTLTIFKTNTFFGNGAGLTNVTAGNVAIASGGTITVLGQSTTNWDYQGSLHDAGTPTVNFTGITTNGSSVITSGGSVTLRYGSDVAGHITITNGTATGGNTAGLLAFNITPAHAFSTNVAGHLWQSVIGYGETGGTGKNFAVQWDLSNNVSSTGLVTNFTAYLSVTATTLTASAAYGINYAIEGR